MLRQEISQALTQAMKAQDKLRLSTLRLIMAAVKDRDIANRGAGKDPVGDDELLGILGKMVKQREESARIYEEGNRIELAEGERAEIIIINDFLPVQMSDDEVKSLRGCDHRDRCTGSARYGQGDGSAQRALRWTDGLLQGQRTGENASSVKASSSSKKSPHLRGFFSFVSLTSSA